MEKIIPMYQKGLEVEECHILGGIDTLYFFVETSSDFSSKLYQNLWLSVLDGSFARENYHFLNFSGKKSGFIGGWYSYIGRSNIPLFRIGFKDGSKQLQVKNIYVQLEGSGIYSLGFFGLLEYVKMELSNLLGNEVTNDCLFPSRVDLNAFVDGFDFGQIDADMFRTKFSQSNPIKDEVTEYEDIDKSYEFRNRRAIETLYLGSKSSPLYFKIYNKDLELRKKVHSISSMVKREFLKSQGFESEHLWQVEFTIKREVLLQYSICTVSDLLRSAGSVFKDLMLKNSFLGFDLITIEKNRQNKNISKLEIHSIWQKIIDNYHFCNYDVDVERVYKEYKKGSHDYSKAVILRELLRQIELEQGITILELNSLFLQSKKASQCLA